MSTSIKSTKHTMKRVHTMGGKGCPAHNRDTSGQCVANAFSLLEMVLVMAVIGLLSILVVPAYSSITSATALTKGANDLTQILEGSRTYAMARHTYVWIGFSNLTATGNWRLQTIAIASLDGTTTNTPSNITTVFKTSRIDNLYLASLPTQPNPTVTDPWTSLPITSGLVYSPEGELLCAGAIGSNARLQLLPAHGFSVMLSNAGATIAVNALTGRQSISQP